MEFTDKEMLDWLETQLLKQTYTGKCVFRWSSRGRGFRLHETSQPSAVKGVRAALRIAMRNDIGKGE